MANRILTRVTPSLDGAAASLGDNSRSLALKIPSGEYDTPLWLRTEAGLVVKVDSLPWQGVLPAGAIEVLSADPAGGGGGSFDLTEDWPTIGALNAQLLGTGSIFESVPGVGLGERALRGIVAAPAEWEGITPNNLEIEMLGGSSGSHLLCETKIPEQISFAVRMYIRVVPGNTNIMNHSSKLSRSTGPGDDMQAVLFATHSPFGGGTVYHPFINLTRTLVTAQAQFEGPELTQGPYNRFEWLVEIVDLGDMLFRFWVRVYDMDDVLIRDSSDWVTTNSNFPGTLEQLWTTHGVVCTASSWDELCRLAVGYEGPGGGGGVGQPGAFWYHAGVAVKFNPTLGSSPWVGPHPNN